MGISLGVGIVVAVELINDSALAAFSESVDLLAGKATHSIVSGYGRIEERLFAEVWKNRAVQSASPIIEAMAVTLETGDEPVRFLGVDPFLDTEFRRLTPGDSTRDGLTEFVAEEIPSAYLSQDLIRKYHLGIGGILTVSHCGYREEGKNTRRYAGADATGARRKYGCYGHIRGTGSLWPRGIPGSD